MFKKDLNFEKFINDLSTQAVEVIPNDISEKDAKFIVDQICKFCKKTSDEIKDQKDFSSEQKKILIQIIAEWVFHKSTDLCHTDIDDDLKKSILESLVNQTSITVKTLFLEKISLEKTLMTVEEKINKNYYDNLMYLYSMGKITESTLKNALAQSNIDKMSKEMSDCDDKNTPEKFFKKIIKLIEDIMNK